MKNYIGIDIGISGGMSLINENEKILACEPIPIIEVMVGKKMRNQYDIGEIYAIIKRWSDDYLIARAGFERLRAIPNQRSQVAFSMGGGSMMFKTIFTIMEIPFMEMESRLWQKEIFNKLGIQYDGKTTKKASVQAAKQLFPGTSFRRTERSRVDSPDLTDSACIALYIKRLDN